ncbi:unnamed protein product [Adineta ricciae]|uniref:Uncharacterized protein n=1 Tax=Adineta ricciae TaxID=249248 RepID=A0A815PLS8_ADIRI|nr:unnamed protein product [Adineta ricciae]
MSKAIHQVLLMDPPNDDQLTRLNTEKNQKVKFCYTDSFIRILLGIIALLCIVVIILTIIFMSRCSCNSNSKRNEQSFSSPANEYITIEEQPRLVIQEKKKQPIMYQFPRATYVENNFVVASDD